MGESLTPSRLQIYAVDLDDLTEEQLDCAFGRARRELKFFPKIAELRELAGATDEDQRKIEAEAAWKFAVDYLQMHGADLMPTYSNGQRQYPPPLPPRIEYALRRIGGLRALNNMTDDARPFAYKDFAEAYFLAPIAEQLTLRLQLGFGGNLPGQVKQLTDGKKTGGSQARHEENPPGSKMKPIPKPMTDVELRDRREMLRQQVAALAAKGRQVEGLKA